MPSITIADLQNAKLDVDHIADIVTSTAGTATDRLGTVKNTIAGSLALIAADVASVDTSRIAGQGLMDADVAAVDASKNTAINTLIPAAIALVDTAVAATAAGAATAAKVAAEAARDMAATSASRHATTADGITATNSTTNKYFSVPSTGSSYMSLYRNDAGVATFINSYPSSAMLQMLPSESGYVFAIMDATGAAVFLVGIDGKVYIPMLVLPANSVEKTMLSSAIRFLLPSDLPPECGLKWALADTNDIYPLACTDDGLIVGNFFAKPSAASITLEMLSSTLISQLAGVSSRWASKKWAVFGDSISDSKATPTAYTPIVATKLGLTLSDYAWSGSRIRQAFHYATTAASVTGYDVATIMHGTNDFKLETPIGSISDSASLNTTFYGDYKAVIEQIIAWNPAIRIFIFTPIRRTQFAATGTDTNSLGLKLIDYVIAVRAIAAYYSLPLLELYDGSGFNTLTIPTWTADGLHPNTIAHANVMAPSVIGFFNSH